MDADKDVGLLFLSGGSMSDAHLKVSPHELMERLPGTLLTGCYDVQMVPGKNVLRCSTLQLVWDHLGGVPELEKSTITADSLNMHLINAGEIDDASHVAMAEIGGEKIVERIQAALTEKFGADVNTSLLPDPADVGPVDLFAYAFLLKSMEFATTFWKTWSMKQERSRIFKLILVTLFTVLPCCAVNTVPSIELDRVPDGGIQPLLISDPQGAVHLLYYKALNSDSKQGHLYYRQYLPTEQQWLQPVRVSTTAYSNAGPVGRASMALDDRGRLHVSWFTVNPAFYYYSRSNQQKSEFEAELALLRVDLGEVEAGAALAVYGDKVTLSWHAGPLDGEAARTVYNMTSVDRGETFNGARQLGDMALGACACCGLDADFNSKGELLVSYRSAVNGEGRHMQLLMANGSGTNTRVIHQWKLNVCPVSTNYLSQDAQQRNWLAFETKGNVYQVRLAEKEMIPTQVRAAAQKTRQKHPAMAFNDTGHRVVVWGEGFGFFSGGLLNLQLFNSAGEPIPSIEMQGQTIPDNSFAAVTALHDGSFMVLY